jgi:tRNA (guanosine-2'-O-)-methyltransferase
VDRADDDCFEPNSERPWPAGWTPEGVIHALERWVGEERRMRIRQVVERRLRSVTIVLDAPHDPHNGAAVLRSAEAFGVQRVHVVTRVEPFVVGRRVTQGAHNWLDVVEHSTEESALTALKGRFRLIATHPEGRLVPDALASIPEVALILGNEHTGISDALTAAADDSVRIPMRGFVESLNVSVSAAILLHAATRSRDGDLPDAERRRVYACGLVRSVPRAADILTATEPS